LFAGFHPNVRAAQYIQIDVAEEEWEMSMPMIGVALLVILQRAAVRVLDEDLPKRRAGFRNQAISAMRAAAKSRKG
jgi:hypothetical protein